MANQKDNFANFMRHTQDLPCNPHYGIHGPNFPVGGDTWSLKRCVEAQDWGARLVTPFRN